MSATEMATSYGEYALVEEAFQRFLDPSLEPRVPDSLFDLVAALDLPRGSSVVAA